MLRIHETDICFGLPEPMTVLHVTDLHLLHADARSSSYALGHAAARKPVFPRSHGVEEELLLYLKENRPDLLLLTGDIIDFPSPANLDALDRLIRTADCPYLFVPGNHDWTYPRDYQSDEQAQSYLPLFGPWTGGDPAFRTLRLGGVLWIGVDDSRRDSVTEVQAKMLGEALSGADPAVVCLHVPICSDALKPEAERVWNFPVVIGDERADTPTRRFCDLVSEKAAAVIAGHVHFTHDAPLDGSRCVQYITALAAEGNVRVFHIR